ncbi:uncharacterized protein [Ptychodera flava]|uniref:uncharacterized protein n=1 Tax=Ptychodera flava TaxID=63121 RepID=UPI00396A2DC4
MAVRSQPITRTHESDNDDSMHSGSPNALYSTPNKGRKQKHTGQGRTFDAGRVWPDESSDSSTTDCDDGSYELLNEPLPPRRYEPQYENTHPNPGNIRVNSKEENVARINSPTVRHGPVLDYKRRNRPAKVREYENLKRNDNVYRSDEASGGVRKQVEPNVENLVYAQLDLPTKTQPPKKSAKGRGERSDYSTIDHLRTENLRRERKNAAADV